MSIKLTTLALLLCIPIAVSAQWTATQTAFGKFASKSDSLRSIAYKKRDAKAYDRLVNQFETEYKKRSATDKTLGVMFKGNYNSAYYNLACVYSLRDEKENALNTLDKSIKLGFVWYDTILGDSDMNNIRKEPRFTNMVMQLRSVGDYRYILTKGEKYNSADNRPLPEFTYQAQTEPHLMALRKAFNLDSIAGKGNEVSQIINMLHWIHYLVPHDGQHGNPVVKNAMSMIAECKRDNRGLNCRGLATVLNECYLSMGFKSRFVTCLPKDSLKVDNDCHVINMVYANSLKKWIWIDPTNDAYVMDENGTLLGQLEVRERIIKNQPLIVNPDANWNRKQSEVKSEYLFNYMAKNLYILECPVVSEYDTETRGPGKQIAYIKLLPLDYFNQGPDKEEMTEKNGTKITIYKTNNPEPFWKAPASNVMAAKVN